MPAFNNAEAGYPTASLGQSLTPVSSCPTSSVSAVATQSSALMFQPVNISPKPAAKRSPMLWPKRNANVVPLNDPGPPLVEWPAAFPVTKEEFCKLHEDFGKEVKLLIAKWSKKGRPEVAQEENLIDFGWSQHNWIQFQLWKNYHVNRKLKAFIINILKKKHTHTFKKKFLSSLHNVFTDHFLLSIKNMSFIGLFFLWRWKPFATPTSHLSPSVQLDLSSSK